MPDIKLGELSATIQDDWQVQGQMTILLPSADPNLKPNIILSKEYLPKPVDLATYSGKVKESIMKRDFQNLKISEEKDITISGINGKMIFCSWDISATTEKLKQKQPDAPVPSIKPNLIVRQARVILLKENLAVNMTASFPADKFEEYYKQFRTCLKSLKIT